MIRRDLRSDREQRALVDAEFGNLALGLNVGNGEMTTLGLGNVLDLGQAQTELDSDVAVLVLGPLGNNLATVHLQNGHRHALTRCRIDTGHADLLCNNTRPHGVYPFQRRSTLRA